MADVTVTGGAKFAMVGAQLKAAGLEGRGLKNELLKNIRVAAQPMAKAAQQAALSELPKRGGMNLWYGVGVKGSKSSFGVRNRIGGTRPGVRIVAHKGGHSMKQADSGKVSHPVPNTKVWRSTTTKRGWFEDALNQHKPEVQAAVLLAMTSTVKKIRGL